MAFYGRVVIGLKTRMERGAEQGYYSSPEVLLLES